MKKFKYSFIVGRFQPLHLGHEQLIEKALEVSEHVIVFLGSSQESGTEKNPFTPEERQFFFYQSFKKDINRFTFIPLPDTENNLAWITSIIDSLDSIVNQASICNVCFNKDKETTLSNDLLKNLWHSTIITVEPLYPSLSATSIRKIIFEDEVCPLQLVDKYLSRSVARILYTRKYVPLPVNFRELNK